MSIKHTTVRDLIESPYLAQGLANFMRLADSPQAKQIAYQCLAARYEMLKDILAIVDTLPVHQELELFGAIPRDDWYEELYQLEIELDKGLV